jgi:hypothetical protein
MTHTYILKDEENNFQDFLKDKSIKKYIEGKLSYNGHMIIFISDEVPNETQSYMMLKYGDMIKDLSYMVPDRSPVMFEDYWPEEQNKFTKYIYENKRNTQRRKI